MIMSILKGKQKPQTINSLIDDINTVITNIDVAVGSIEESATNLGADVAELPDVASMTSQETSLLRLKAVLTRLNALHDRTVSCSAGLYGLV
jgi:hypothetical protein